MVFTVLPSSPSRFERVDCLVEMGVWAAGRGLSRAGSDYLHSALDILYDVEEKVRVSQLCSVHSSPHYYTTCISNINQLYSSETYFTVCPTLGSSIIRYTIQRITCTDETLFLFLCHRTESNINGVYMYLYGIRY